MNPHFSRPSAGTPGNGTTNGEARRTLHLSHRSANGSERGGDPSSEHGLAARPAARHPAAPPHDSVATMQAAVRLAGEGIPGDFRSSEGDVRGIADPLQSKEGGAINQALRERVHADTAAFLAAFDAALADDTAESRAGLRAATDRLLRAGARTRIELERLEARLPLPPRDKPVAAVPAWRQR
jgi:hypothetical protein